MRFRTLSLAAGAALALGACSGADGTQGPAGDKGIDGINGVDGTSGTDGVAGIDGTNGIDGKDGISVGTVKVTVVDAEGTAISGATVFTVPATSSATTDTAGAATLADVPIGVYAVWAQMEGMHSFAQNGVSVTAGGTAALKATLGEGVEYGLIEVVGVSGARGDTDSMANPRATLTAGDNYLIISSGLRNVAVGSFVYVVGAAADEAEVAFVDWAWTLTGPAGSSATLEYTDTGDASGTPERTWSGTASRWARFRTDVAGAYQVHLDANNGTTVESRDITITAGNYVGQQNCAGCHSNEDVVGKFRDVYPDFMLTGHATKFQGTFSRYSGSMDSCIPCHVTGYDESAANGGFDDMMQLAGWDPASGSVGAYLESNYAGSLAAFLGDPATLPAQSLMNIQCEACHGPGSNHPDAESHLTWSPDNCKQCHPQPNQWALSKHSLKPPEHMAGSSSCVECHTGQGFVVVKDHGEAPVFPNDATESNPANMFEPGNAQPIGCATCHDPHKFSYPYLSGGALKSDQLRFEGEVVTPQAFTVAAEKAAVCVKCHANKRNVQYLADFLAGNESRGAHDSTQTDVLEGKGAYEYAGKTYGGGVHASLIAEKCVGCHMDTRPNTVDANGDPAVCTTNADCDPTEVCSHSHCAEDKLGGHTFNMTWVDPISSTEYQHLSTCNQGGCHSGLTEFNRVIPGSGTGGYDCDDTTTGVQSEIAAMLDSLRDCLIAANSALDDGSGGLKTSGYSTATTVQLQAIWNYFLIKNDGSLGVHNAKFAGQLLRDAYESLSCSPAYTCARP